MKALLLCWHKPGRVLVAIAAKPAGFAWLVSDDADCMAHVEVTSSTCVMAIVPMAQVSQLAGYVSEHSAYHHGDVSLTSTIVGMAQNFVGSNNVNLLYPSG